MEKQRVKDVLLDDIPSGRITKVFVGNDNYIVDMELYDSDFYCPVYWNIMYVNFYNYAVTIAIQKDKFNKLYQNNG